MYRVLNIHTNEFAMEYDFIDGEIKPRSVVSLEAFFNGNDEQRSISCLFPEVHPGAPFFYELLKNIRNQEDVENVLIEITGIEINEVGDKFMWPFSERVYIITSASQEEVSNWVKPLMPNVISEGWLYDVEPEQEPAVLEGNKVFALYWGYEYEEKYIDINEKLEKSEMCPFCNVNSDITNLYG